MSDSTRTCMGWPKVGLLVGYLAVTAALSGYFVWGLWGAVPSTADLDIRGIPDFDSITPPANKIPTILRIDPPRITYGMGRPAIRVFGHHFTQDSNVVLDGVPRMTDFIDSNQLVVRLRAADFTYPGNVVLNVREEEQVSNVATLLIA